MAPFAFVPVMKALGTRFGVLAISTLMARSPRIMPLSLSAAVASALVANSTKANCPPLPATRASTTAPHTENVARRCSTPIPAPRFLTITDVAVVCVVGRCGEIRASPGDGVGKDDDPENRVGSAPGLAPAKNTGKGDPSMGCSFTTTPTL